VHGTVLWWEFAAAEGGGAGYPACATSVQAAGVWLGYVVRRGWPLLSDDQVPDDISGLESRMPRSWKIREMTGIEVTAHRDRQHEQHGRLLPGRSGEGLERQEGTDGRGNEEGKRRAHVSEQARRQRGRDPSQDEGP
jgi:hypothetical protein